MLSLSKLYVLKVTLMMFRCYNKELPKVITNLFVRNEEVHQYNTRRKACLCVPNAKLNCLCQSFRIKGVHWWNFFLEKVDSKCSLPSFKRKIKEYILTHDIQIK